jgi:mRNA interferase RelE/StbE
MEVKIRKSALKDLQKIPEPHRSRVKEKVALLQDFPDIVNVKKLKNHPSAFRLRVGEYRVLFDLYDDHIEVAAIKHRKESY